MSIAKKSRPQTVAASAPRPSVQGPSEPPEAPADSRARLLRRIRNEIDAARFDEALRLLEQYGRAPEAASLRSVCLMRLGQPDAALAILRELVLQSGCTWMKTHVPKDQQLNFATALLLTGRPNGCADVLDEIDDESHPGVVRLRNAVQRWERTLSWWQRLHWYLGRIAPANCQVTIDFPPGETEDVLSAGSVK